MVDGHERAAWNKVVVAGIMALRAGGAKGLPNPIDLIPERYREAPEAEPLTEEEEEAQTAAAFASFETALAAWYHAQD